MRKKKVKEVKVVQDPEFEIAAEIIAESILKMQKAMDEMNGTRLTRQAIVILISHRSKLPQYQVELVLNNLDQLAATWLKKVQ